MDIVALVVVEDVVVVTFHDDGFRQLVVGVYEQAHGVDDEADGVGGIESESLVGDNGHLGHLLHEILGDKGYDVIGAHEYGYLLLSDTCLK